LRAIGYRKLSARPRHHAQKAGAVDHCCDAWNKLEAQPWTIMSIGLRNWGHGS
jgi:hypothetical protein